MGRGASISAVKRPRKRSWSMVECEAASHTNGATRVEKMMSRSFRRGEQISPAGEIREGPETGSGGVWEASDDALLAGYATGDYDAAALFVRRFQGKVFGLAVAITRAPVDAEEVA